jgi:hypothetical protein
MANDLDVNLSSKEWLLRVATGAAISMLLVLIVGVLFGLLTYSAMNFLQVHANRSLGVAALLLNSATLLLVLWLLSVAIGRAEEVDLFRPNVSALRAARLVALVMIFEVLFSFIATELRNFVVIYIGNFTQLNFLTTVWTIVLGIIVPAAILAALLIFSPKWLRTVGGSRT